MRSKTNKWYCHQPGGPAIVINLKLPSDIFLQGKNIATSSTQIGDQIDKYN